MINDVTLSGPRCCVTLKGASRWNVIEVMGVLTSLVKKCAGLEEQEVSACIHSELEAISGDGHDFGWELDFNSAID